MSWFRNLFEPQRNTSISLQEEEWKHLPDQLRSKTSEECYQNAMILKSEKPEAFGPVLQCLVEHLETQDILQIWKSYFRSLADARQLKFAEPPAAVKVFLVTTAQTYGAEQQMLDQLNAQGTRVTGTDDPQQCDVILLFCPVLSRVGSDVDAVVKKIPVEGKPVVLVLMHHTFNPDQYLDKTLWSEHYPCIKQEVRVLYHKSQNGLLNCPRNQEALLTLQSLCDQFSSSSQQSGQRPDPMKDHSMDTTAPPWKLHAPRVVEEMRASMSEREAAKINAIKSDGSSGVSASHRTSSQSQLDPEDMTMSEELHQRTKKVSVEVPGPTMFDRPWRKIDWGDKKKLLDKINRYTPRFGEKHLRILVYGPVGAGKSSFINSVTSSLYERMCYEAVVNPRDLATRAFTLKYETHKIYKDEGYSDESYPFVFNDMMGMEGGDRMGIHPQDIKSAMMGHMKEGYKFNPMSPLEKGDSHYNPNPTIDDRVHVLVLMISANCPQIDSVIQKMKEVRETARELGIPQLAVVTHVDVNCPEIQKDIRNIYLSKTLKEKMEEFSHAVELPLNCIMGVKNYSEETDTDDNIDTLILIALRNMVHSGMDFVRKIKMSDDLSNMKIV